MRRCDSRLARLHSGRQACRNRALWGNVDSVFVPAPREVMECVLCTCDKMGAPWVAKDAMAVIIIILTMCLKIGHGATLRHASLNNSKP